MHFSVRCCVDLLTETKSSSRVEEVESKKDEVSSMHPHTIIVTYSDAHPHPRRHTFSESPHHRIAESCR
jgi:hypothetical protein